MKKVYIYWDNANVFLGAQRLAEEQSDKPGARFRVRMDFDNLLRLAHADREIGCVITAGSVPPEMKQLWYRMENEGVEVELFDRIASGQGEQEPPDRFLQLRMLEHGFDAETLGTVVLITGDGSGYSKGDGFQSALERLHEDGWQVEVLSWAHSCKRRMREWTEKNGTFIALDDFYNSITLLEPSRPGHEIAPARDSVPLDLSKRAII